jgi:amino acid adenylation domain-containing protein/non-ribosomal peptide synthase protein (TIGR01720 family)
MKDVNKEKTIEIYWLNRLSGDLPKISLPSVPGDGADNEAAESPLCVPIPGSTANRLKEVCKGSDTGLFVLFLSGLSVVLHKYTGLEDLVVGTVNPRKEGVKKDKLLLCRNLISADLTFKQTIHQVNKNVTADFNHWDYSFGAIYQRLVNQKKSSAHQGPNSNPGMDSERLDIFNIAFIYHQLQNRSQVLNQFDVVILLTLRESQLVLEIENRSTVYSQEILLRFGRNLVHVLEHFEKNLERRISIIDILSQQEKAELLDFNRSEAPYPGDKTTHRLFEEQAEKTGDTIAVIGSSHLVGMRFIASGIGTTSITYRELNEKSNQLAHFLQRKGVTAGTIVGLMKERSINMVTAMLGILKAGGAYLPLDSQAPTHRITSMLEECKAPFLLTEKRAMVNHAYTSLQGLDSEGIKPHLTGPCERITDFDSLPFPDRSLVDVEKYNQTIGQAIVKNRIMIQAARGCPHKCAYCYRIWPRQQVARSGENIFEEIRFYYNLGIKKFDIFMLNISKGKRLFELIIQHNMRDIQLFFPNGFRGDLLTRDYIDLMVKAGTVNFALALETASPRLQKLINKHLNLDKFREIVEYMCETYPHIILELFTLHGIPTETEEEAMMTLNFIKSLKWVHFPYVNVLKIYHNTGMEQLALENGISRESILRSENMAWHEWSDTLPFDRSFTAKYQSDFLSQYVLSRERLLKVLPFQMRILSEDEFVQKYDSYLPVDIKRFNDFLEFANLQNEAALKQYGFRDETEDNKVLTGFNERLRKHFPVKEPSRDSDALRVLLLDLSQFFSDGSNMLYDVVDPPLGLMYLLTYLNQQLGHKIYGKIIKSRIDFDSHEALKKILEAFQPQVIGIRTLTYYKDFFHRTVALMREWGIDVPIITGGPYATVDYETLLKDRHIDIAVLGEGEITFCKLIEVIIANKGKLPADEVLETIPGIAFVPRSDTINTTDRDFAREIIAAEDLPEVLALESLTNLERDNMPMPQDPAYIIFTSGSTGKPKGVIVEHNNAVNVLTWFGDTYQLQPGTRVIQLANYTFDPSVEQIFSALLRGATLYIAPRELLTDKTIFRSYVDQHQINIINLVPAVLKELLAEDQKLGSVEAVISGAERLEETLKNRLLEKGYRLYNHYGPTETTIEALAGECSRKPVTLGKPIANMACYILGKDSHPVPIGVKGELCISGAGVTRGYLNNPELTNSKFQIPNYKQIPNPKSQITNISEETDNFLPHSSFIIPHSSFRSLYTTGDLARWLPDGTVEFFGRTDDQIKIRGFRIEPGEIETQLLKHKDLKEVIVIDRESETGDKYLCAYVVPREAVTLQNLDPLELKDFLAQELPFYMIPAHIVPMKRLPVTAADKVDRSALPLPGITTAVQYAAPEDENQELLVDIWSQVLGIKKERIGIDTNFFETGGDSIKVIQISARLRKHGLKLENGNIFLYPTIKQLSPYVKPLDHIIDQGTVEGDVPLTPIQQWFFQENAIDSHHFNQAVMLFSPEGFDPEAVKAIFGKIQRHHDALRMTFKRKGCQVVQTNQGEEMPLFLEIFDLRNYTFREEALQALNEGVNRVQASMNLETGPLMKLGLFQLSDGDRLLIAVHHLVIDGISWRILFEDIDRLFRQYRSKDPLELPQKTDSFQKWGEQLAQYAQSSTFLKEKAFWKAMESVQIPRIETDFPAAPDDTNCRKESQNLAVLMSPEQTELLLTRVNNAFGTDINDILLTGLGLALHTTYGLRQLLIAMEGHGREDILEGVDITRTVGWFTSQYPVLLDISHTQNLGRQVKEVKEALRRVPHKGIGYGILRYLTEEQYKKEMAFNLKPQIGFNYLGQFDADLETTGFGMAVESVGHTQSEKGEREHELEVTAMIANQQLVLSIHFNKKHFKAATIDALLNIYQSELTRLIDFCVNRVNCKERERTPSDFTCKALSVEALETIEAAVKGAIEDIYTLTPMQEGMLFHAVYDRDEDRSQWALEQKETGAFNIFSSAYFEQISYLLQGKLDIDVIKKSLNELIKRHDILRTAFIHQGLDRPVQVVLKERKVDFYYKDISENIPAEERETFIQAFKAQDRRRSFDLSKDVLMRVSVIRTGKNQYEFIWSHHHIVMDGWCNGILINEFFHIYNRYLQNREHQLPPVKAYRTYIQWLEAQDRELSKHYWATVLSGYNERVEIPKLKPYPPASRDHSYGYVYKNEKVSISMNAQETQQLIQLTALLQVTLNTILQTLWGILLGYYNGRQDVVFGAVVSGRPAHIEDVEKMVGLFINTIPVRIRHTDTTFFGQLVKQAQEAAIKSEPHHYYPLAEIQSYSPLKQHLLDHILVFENFPLDQQIDRSIRDPGAVEPGDKPKETFQLSRIEAFEQTNYDFNLIALPGPRLKVRFEYNGNIYDQAFVKAIGRHLQNALHCILDYPDLFQLPVNKITFLSDEEKKQLLKDFNATESPYPRDKTIHQLFEEQVERAGHKIALVGYSCHVGTNGRFIASGTRTPYVNITYRELNEKSNQLAHILRGKGVEPDQVVAVLADRSTEMIAAIIAILKAGGAYLPLDAQYPINRINYMLADSGTRILLTSPHLVEGKALEVEILDLEESDLSRVETVNPGSLSQPYHLLHLLYTSGSTGRPKGVMLEHRSVVNFIYHLHENLYTHYKTSSTSHLNLAVIAPYIFAGSVKQVFTSLVFGHALFIVPDECRFDGERLATFFKENTIHITDATPAHIRLLVEAYRHREDKQCGVRHFNISADVLPKQLVSEFLNELEEPKPDLANLYGPTECCVDATAYRIDPAEVESLCSVPIGAPMANTSVYVLNRHQEPVPVGVIGEIHISGHGVARGYLNDPELTAEKFNQDFQDDQDYQDEKEKEKRGGKYSFTSLSLYPSTPLYRTGDLGRWLPGGRLEFFGRKDNQVNIRGYRIETGEIETQMQRDKTVQTVFVRPAQEENGETVLCAYIVSKDSTTLTPSQWREYLSKELPHYMIPSYFIQVQAIPFTPAGKVDLKALPQPEVMKGSGKKYQAPTSEAEGKMVEIWAEVLGMEPGDISVHDDFFQLGGNSITIFKVVNRINHLFRLDISLSALFLYPTIRQLAENIQEQALFNKLESVVRLNRASKGKNIFIIHPMHGMVYQYRDLAIALEESHIIYGIQARGLVKSSPLPETMDDMVMDYIQQIRTVQPEGPYLIAGHCFGDIVAYNLVKQMENMNQEVERLIMFDEPAFIPAFVVRYFHRKDLIRSIIKPVKKLVPWIKKSDGEEVVLTPYQQALADFKNRETGSAAGQGNISPVDSDERKARVHIHIKRMDTQYWKTNPYRRQLGIIKAPLLILKASERDHPGFEKKALKRMTYGEVTLRETPGTHHTIFQKQHIDTLSRILKESIQV